VVRMLDTMILRYFERAGLLDVLLGLPDLAITTSVRRELRRWDVLSARVDAAVQNHELAVYDVDPGDETEGTLYFFYRERDGFGDGEATSMAVAHNRGFGFVSHDLAAAAKIRGSGINVLDWPDLLAELRDAGALTLTQHAAALREIRRMLKRR